MPANAGPHQASTAVRSNVTLLGDPLSPVLSLSLGVQRVCVFEVFETCHSLGKPHSTVRTPDRLHPAFPMFCSSAAMGRLSIYLNIPLTDASVKPLFCTASENRPRFERLAQNPCPKIEVAEKPVAFQLGCLISGCLGGRLPRALAPRRRLRCSRTSRSVVGLAAGGGFMSMMSVSQPVTVHCLQPSLVGFDHWCWCSCRALVPAM